MTLASHLFGARPLVFQTRRRSKGLGFRPVQPVPVDPKRDPPDLRLLARIGAEVCLRYSVLPWRDIGGRTIILCSNMSLNPAAADALGRCFGDYRLALVGTAALQTALMEHAGPTVVRAAETRTPAAQSCRTWDHRRTVQLFVGMAACMAAALVWNAGLTMLALVGLACFALLANAALKVAALVRLVIQTPAAKSQNMTLLRQPVVSILVPLYHEKEVAGHIIQRLSALSYPRALLDVCLIIEDDDAMTRAALEQVALPDWAQVVEVPEGALRTKPRALNYAMTRAKGAIIGIYDAEDAPEPEQIDKVVRQFAQRPRDVACLQGALDYYNPYSNWLSRCFTLEYATWFRMILPTLQWLGLVIPLGGTTLFLRREAIEAVGGWDAHNVTEDADLGLRLARAGYRTEIIDTVTMEEANARAWPWVRQRSRWLKGYAMTYAVHMRDPLGLLRDLGLWRFAGVQMLFLGTLIGFVLAPLLWSFWLILLGLPHPIRDTVSDGVLTGMVVLFVSAEGLSVAVAVCAMARTARLRLAPWALTLQFYFPLATLAVYKGLSELITKPFYWDKTEHGLHVPEAILPPRPSEHPIAAE